MTDEIVTIFEEEEEIEAKAIQVPTEFITVGEIEASDVNIYIRRDVYKELEDLACSDVSREVGSILIGEYSNSLGKISLIISAYIEAKYSDSSAVALTFTHQTWDYIHAERDKHYLDKKIVGWQHTHPDYGIFLSAYDMFIQENFFNLPFQVAYVIDPINEERGFFQWKDGKVRKLKGFHIYDKL